MSTRISVYSSSFTAANDQVPRLSVTSGEVTSVEQRLVAAQPRRVSQSAPAAMPDWYGTLPGVMAGKRPVSKPVPAAMPVWYGTLPGVMAGKRPAQSRPAQSGGAAFSGRAA